MEVQQKASLRQHGKLVHDGRRGRGRILAPRNVGMMFYDHLPTVKPIACCLHRTGQLLLVWLYCQFARARALSSGAGQALGIQRILAR